MRIADVLSRLKGWRRSPMQTQFMAGSAIQFGDSGASTSSIETNSTGPALSAAQVAAGAYWDEVSVNPEIVPRTAWWNDPPTLRHINRIVCGEALDDQHTGFHRRLAALVGEHCSAPARAISIGTGPGYKEMGLLQAGLIGSFDCFEVGLRAVEEGRRLAFEQGLAERIRFHHADAFKAHVPRDYDVVYWNSALHHMPDTAAAVTWSRDHLRFGGIFACDEYVGASKFQHSDALLAWSNRMLATLPDRLLRRPGGTTDTVPRVVARIDPEYLTKIDPTEAVDSENILPAVRNTFQNAEIIPTGGLALFRRSE
jgi:SAM-dependent methyltransferase